jgi:hypothetical protein
MDNNAQGDETTITSTSTARTLFVSNMNTTAGYAFQATVAGTNSSPVGSFAHGGSGIALQLVHLGDNGSHLMMYPSGVTGAPAAGSHAAGEIRLDHAQSLHRCLAPGTPGTWAPMRSMAFLTQPRRVIDTRTGLGVAGGVAGPLIKDRIYTFPSFLGVAAIAAQAVGVVGNLTMVAQSGRNLEGRAWMAIVPGFYADGTSRPSSYPGVSTVNAGVGTDAIANQFTCKLGTGPRAGQISIVWSGSSTVNVHAVVDVAAFLF